MPELPEVQTVVSQLDEKVSGKTIARFWTGWEKKILNPLATFKKRIKGAKILGARRRGKHIIIDLDNGYSIIVHLKMTGHFLYKTPENEDQEAFTKDPRNGFIHHRIFFTDGTRLEFSDMRKFGWLRAEKIQEVEQLASIRSLGIDALSPEMNQRAFGEILQKRQGRTIGEVLLEQQYMAGVGNIYRSEALFLAGVLPERKVNTLTQEEQREILKGVKKVLRQAVRLQGTSDGDFRDLDGLPGNFQRTLYVYQRHEEPCKKCDTIIVRKKLGQRSIFFCPQCQQ